eukprot:6211775-Pleurochrysis_carterae.AAC.2
MSAAHHYVCGGAVAPLARDVCTQRADLKFRRLVEAERDNALQLSYLPCGKLIYHDGYFAPYLADDVVL